ncbi:hypothetical protein LR48_Vigan09g119500 [Vigna angularis]|uniref:Uncharacterized protein n=1 Tax=Phaseolus angularis TaxID=3914 RepID=A0A0L9VBU8_PHAAN|nr:hypothetical protein LR48_Vigan09g119500 [Vigna angularis]
MVGRPLNSTITLQAERSHCSVFTSTLIRFSSFNASSKRSSPSAHIHTDDHRNDKTDVQGQLTTQGKRKAPVSGCQTLRSSMCVAEVERSACNSWRPSGGVSDAATSICPADVARPPAATCTPLRTEAERVGERAFERERGPTECLPECRRTTLKAVSELFNPSSRFRFTVAAAPTLANETKAASSSLQPSELGARSESRFVPPASLPVPNLCIHRRSIAGVPPECRLFGGRKRGV